MRPQVFFHQLVAVKAVDGIDFTFYHFRHILPEGDAT